ncbi:hypothetical protein HID58_044838 [Brassica napus]|uniref:Uncharacterized protein n=1 Tax=Brassica napus TaxID=3708 RepID=A0ABQ7XH98_BRANA|nr:hypothetical protein HID58_044838 [Brassica napus]
MLNPIMSKVFPRWQFLSNHQSDPDGRIIFLWRHLASVKFVSQSRQSLTTEVTLPNHPPITITSIYASNLAEERIDLWAELINTQHQLSLHLKPWLVAGYFNQITHPSEHSSPTVQALSSSMIHFRDTLLQLDYLINLRLPKPHKKLLLIAWQCVIYLLWTERNSRLYRRSFRSPQSLLTTLDLTVRNRCSNLRSQNPATSSSMIQLWFR